MATQLIFAEEVYNRAYSKIRKASACPICEFCARTRSDVRKHIKREHHPEEIVEALNITTDGVLYKFNKAGNIVL